MSFDAFTRVLSQADSRGDFLNQDQFAALSALVAEGNKRLDAVNRITAKSSMIITNAARALFAAQPQLLNPGGNAYTSRRNAACLRDLDIILRYITYAIILAMPPCSRIAASMACAKPIWPSVCQDPLWRRRFD